MTNTASKTKRILAALRQGGLTARAGFPADGAPASEHRNTIVLGGRVVNVNVVDVLGFGCIDHPAYAATRDGLCAKVEAALDACGFSYRKSLPDQYIVEVS